MIPKSKGIIYYTDNKIGEPIKSRVNKCIVDSGLPITSTSLEPIDLGHNIVVEGERGYVTYTKQILTALENSNSQYVFFCEHDVLYPKCHFDFTPPREDIFYYNANVWRWEYASRKAITYDRLISLSGLCCNRELAIEYYKTRMKKISENEGKFDTKEPSLARKWGYEPGTKKKKRGGITEDDFDTWHSKVPMIDIRHKGTFSPSKCTIDSFKHLPQNWREVDISEIEGWNIPELFNLEKEI